MTCVDPEEFRNLSLEVHNILNGLSIHDVFAVDLPGGGAGRTVSDVRALIASENLRAVTPSVKLLVALRARLGQVFGWDSNVHKIYQHLNASYIYRLNDDIKRRSILAPGSIDGRFHLLYLLDREWLGEFRNGTVHALFVIALTETLNGYRLYLGVYVQPVSRLTSIYMALIDPFRHLIVYPAVLRRVMNLWDERYALVDSPSPM